MLLVLGTLLTVCPLHLFGKIESPRPPPLPKKVPLQRLRSTASLNYCYYTARESWEREEGVQAGDRGVHFPPGEHPLEGVPNMVDLAAPEALSARVDLSEVSEELPPVVQCFCVPFILESYSQSFWRVVHSHSGELFTVILESCSQSFWRIKPSFPVNGGELLPYMHT